MATHDDTANELLRTGSGEEGNKEEHSSRVTTYSCSVRFQHALVGLFLGLILFMYRVNISIVLPFMVKTPSELTNKTSLSSVVYNITEHEEESCRAYVEKVAKDNQRAEFSWDKRTQSFVLSGYYYGYVTSQIPAIFVTRRFGGKNVITTCMTISAGLNLLVPVLARASVYAVIFSRVILGAVTGCVIPGWIAIIGAWALPHERSRFFTCHCFGKGVGTVIGYFTGGVLCAHGFDNGWGSVFYVHGALGILFVLSWVFVVANSPEKHSRIEAQERALFANMQFSTKQTVSDDERVPLVAIMTSVPVWAIFITHTLDNVTVYLIVTSLPQFMKDVLKFDIQSNGGFSSLPLISNAVGLVLAGSLGDAIIKRQLWSTTVTRKVFQSIGMIGGAVSIVIPGYTTCEYRAIAIACLCFCMFFNAFVDVGYPCSAIDIAPRYATVIYSISNTFASVPGILIPLLVAELTPNGTVVEWRLVFYITAGLAVFAALIYGVFSSSKLAPWADEQKQTVTIDVDSNNELAEETVTVLPLNSHDSSITI